RPDEDQRPFFDVRQEGVLLRAVEAVDLVHEEDRAGPMARALELRLGDDLTDLLHPREHRGEGDETRADHARQQRGERGLAGARRAPEDHRVELAALERRAEDLAGADEVLLARELVERART